MRVGFDCDGVICDFVEGTNRLCKELFNKDLPPATSWNWMIPTLTPDEAKQFWTYITAPTLLAARFWKNLSPTPWGIELLKVAELLQLKYHEVYFITSRTAAHAKHDIEYWLHIHGFNKFTVLRIDKDTATGMNKGLIAQGLGLDIFIDDHVAQCEGVRESSPDTDTILLEAPYNDQISVLHGIRRLKAEEILTYLRSFTNESV